MDEKAAASDGMDSELETGEDETSANASAGISANQSDYERIREANIAKNKELLRQLGFGLDNKTEKLTESDSEKKVKKKKGKGKKPIRSS